MSIENSYKYFLDGNIQQAYITYLDFINDSEYYLKYYLNNIITNKDILNSFFSEINSDSNIYTELKTLVNKSYSSKIYNICNNGKKSIAFVDIAFKESSVYTGYLEKILESSERNNYNCIFLSITNNDKVKIPENIPIFNIDFDVIHLLGFIDLFISNGTYINKYNYDNFNVALISHGSFSMPLNELFLGASISYFDYVFIPSLSQKIMCNKSINLFRSSYNSLDLDKEIFKLQKNILNRSTFRKTYLIPSGNPKLTTNLQCNYSDSENIILILPTSPFAIREENSIINSVEYITSIILENNKDYKVIFRPFPDKLSLETANNLATKLKNFVNFSVDLSFGNTDEIYKKTKVIITDASTGAFSFMQKTGRPSIFIYNLNEYKNFKNYFDYINKCNEISIAIDSLSINKIPQLINDISSDMDFYNKKIVNFLNKELFNQGNEVNYIWNSIFKILNKKIDDNWTIIGEKNNSLEYEKNIILGLFKNINLVITDNIYFNNIKDDYLLYLDDKIDSDICFDYINRNFDAVIAYSLFHKKVYEELGIIGSKIFIVNPNINDIFYNQSNFDSLQNKYKFLYYGQINTDFGFDILINTFISNFKNIDDVILIIKIEWENLNYEMYEQLENIIINYKNILLIDNYEANITDYDIFKLCDCFVSPYRFDIKNTNLNKALLLNKIIITTKNLFLENHNKDKNLFFIDLDSSTDFRFEPSIESFKNITKYVYENKIFNSNCKMETPSDLNYQIIELENYLKKSNVIKKDLDKRILDHVKNLNEYISIDDFEKSKLELEILLKYYPTNIDYLYNLGVLYFKTNELDKSLEFLSEALNLGCINYSILITISKILETMGDHETSNLYYEKANNFKI
jgi:hypothetical protein